MTCREAGSLGGRPTLLTPRLQQQICKLIEKTACTYYTAALSLGIDPEVVYYWDLKGREGKQPYRAFLGAVLQARAKAQIRLLEAYEKDCQKGREGASGRGQAWILERRFPEDFDNRYKFDQQLAALSASELDEYIAACDAVWGNESPPIEGELVELPESAG